MTPFHVDSEFAAMIVAKGEFSEGGFRVCFKCDRSQEVDAEQIIKWFSTALPRCKICDNRTVLLTHREQQRRISENSK